MNKLMFGAFSRTESLVLSFINGSHKKVVAFVTLLSILAISIPVAPAYAATTAVLTPNGQGTYTQWSGDEGNVDETGTPSCSTFMGGDIINTSTTGNRESVLLNLSGLSDGSIIESVDVTVWYSSASTNGGGTFKTFARLDNTDVDASADLVATGTSSNCSHTSTQSIDVADTIKSGTTNLQIGVLKTAGDTSEVRVGAIRAVVTYADTTPPPAPSITVGPAEGSTITTANTSFSFTSEAGATFECKTDAGAFAVCTSPKSLTSLAEGAHTFTVKAKDGAGNYSSETIRNFTVDIDTDAPAITAVTVLPITTNDTTPSFSLNTNEAGQVIVGGTSCSIPTTNAVVGDNTITFNTLSNGNTYNCTVRVRDAALNLSNILTVAITVNTNIFDAGMVSLSFDDGWQSIYDNALSLLDAKGYKSTQYIYTDAFNGVHGTIYMNAGEIADLKNAGHDIAAHSRTHSVALSGTVATSTRESEIDGSRLDILSLTGATMKPVNNFAYPFGDGDTDPVITAQLKSAGFAGARGTQDGFNDKATGRYALKIFEVTRNTTLAEMTAAVDVAKNTKTWVIFMFHQIEDVTCPAGAEFDYCLTTETLSDLLDYIQTSGLSVKTVAEGLAMMPSHPSSGTAAPVITQADIVVPATSASGAVVTYSPTVADSDAVNSPAPLRAYCTAPGGLVSGSMFPVGVTTVTCSAADAGGTLATTDTSFTVTVNADTVVPTVVLSSAVVSPTAGSPASLTATFSEAVLNFTASDVQVTNATTPVSNFVGSGTTYTFNVVPTADGVVTVTVPASAANDAFGNGNTISNTITFTYDHTAPVVTLSGDAAMNLHTSDTYTEQGATAVDAIDASVAVVITGSVNTAVPGTYVLTYSSTDDAGNIGTATRTVNVSDATAPVITGVPANMTLEATSAAGAVGTYTLPTATDDVDGLVAVVCTPAAGSTFALGLTTVNCSATDAALNVGTVSFTVTVLDTTIPVLTAPADQTFEATGIMTTPALVLATVSDIADPAPVVTYDIHNFGIGTETVTWGATDAALNVATPVTSLVTIVDTTAPVIDIELVALNLSSVPPIVFTATDLVTANPTLECKVDGGVFVPCISPFITGILEDEAHTTDGAHTVVVKATDAAGNSAESNVSFTLDTVDPTAVVTYNITTLTNTDVIATLGSESEAITITSVGGSTHTFTENGSFTFEFVDVAGNTGSALAMVSNIDKVAPTVTIDVFGAVNSANQTSVTVSGGCSENDLPVTLALGALSAAPNCAGGAWTSTFDLSEELDGSLSLSASQTDAATNVTTVTGASTKDTVTPTASVGYDITAPTNTDVVATITPSETVTVTNNGGLLTHTFTENSSFTFEFTDTAGNPGSAIASVANIDKTLPSLSITSAPAASINVNAVSVTYVAEIGTTVTCAITGGGTIDSCSDTTAAISAILDGPHTFTVTATDSVGNASTATATFVVDFTDPVVTIDSVTGLPASPSITFSVVDDSVVTTECEVNAGAFVSCTSPFAPTLTDGTYTVTVRAIDAVGNESLPVTTTPFTVDLPPTITLVGVTPLVYPQDAAFVDPGATATDFVDGDITSSIVVTGSVNTAVLGTYPVTYTVTDTAGNVASTTRSVVVTDLILSGEQNGVATSNSAEVVWTTSHPATSRVLYDTVSHSDAEVLLAGPGNYGYAFSTVENPTLVTDHVVAVSGLSSSVTYYFRPVSHGSPELVGAEVSVTTQSAPAAPSTQASNTGNGGGGGGGGGGSIALSSYGVKINDGAATTNSANVTLAITKPTTATQMWISNTPDLFGTSWMNFQSSMPWTLTQGSGTKNVYVRFGFASSTVATAQTSIQLSDGSTPVSGLVLGASTVGTGNACYVFTQTLSTGSTGVDVTEVQKRLTAEGVYSGPITGYFGAMTKAAVIAYQTKHSLAQVGIVGPQTRAALNVCSGTVLGASTTVPSSGLSEEAKAKIMEQLSGLLALVAKLQAELAAMKGQ